MKSLILFISLFFTIACSTRVQAQDTLSITLKEFIQKGVEHSGQIAYQKQSITLAENRVAQAKSQRILPKFELSTQHGVIPGVKSNTNLPKDQLYLDPNLENDFEDLAIFTRAELTAVQPIFTWGAISNAINAAQLAAKAATQRFESQKADIEIRLFELYHSYLLTLEVNRLLDEASEQIDKIGKKIDSKRDSADADIDESDIYKFKIFKSEFAIRSAEVKENSKYIRSVWDYILQTDKEQVYEPETPFLDPVKSAIEELDYYRVFAVNSRPEIKAIDAGISAAEYGVKATKAQRYPSLFLGFTGSYANTPNRPRQSNPFIINNTNFATAAVGFGIRQNLNFLSLKANVDRSQIQYNQTKYLKEAAVDGIVLEINESYKNASLSKIKVTKTDEALTTGKKWLRQEQLDYDFGIGDIKDLLDAMKKELELRVQLKQSIFDLNKNMAELYKASGMEISSLQMDR